MSGTEEQNLNIQPGAEQAGSQSGTDNNAQIESLKEQISELRKEAQKAKKLSKNS